MPIASQTTSILILYPDEWITTLVNIRASLARYMPTLVLVFPTRAFHATSTFGPIVLQSLHSHPYSWSTGDFLCIESGIHLRLINDSMCCLKATCLPVLPSTQSQ